jgi:hypothetical protein
MADDYGYWHITATPGPNLYADHNRERRKVCRTCRKPFVARTPNALDCGVCRALTVRARRELRERVGR